MQTFRMILPSSATARIAVANGRSYQVTPGAIFDANERDIDALHSVGAQLLAAVGATAQRPTDAHARMPYIDTDLGKVVMFDGHTWRDPVTGVAV